jgi:hypothetical protein
MKLALLTAVQLIINDADERQAAIDGIENVTRIVARFRTVEVDYVSGRYGTNGDFEKRLVALYRAVALFYIKTACYFAKSTLFRTIRGIVEADAWKHTLDSIKSTESESDRFVTMLVLSKSLDRIDKVLEDLSRIELKDLIKDVERWLIPDVDVGQQHQAKRPKLASGYDKAGSWLLDSPEFKSWEGGDEGAEQFWINGAVGTGKSSLVAVIVDRMRAKDNVAFYYCTVNIIGAATLSKGFDDAAVTQVLRGLLGQLAMSPDGKKIAEEIEVAVDQASHPGALGRVPLGLEDAKDLLVRIINARRDTTIIIDGLDEMPEYSFLLRTLKVVNDRVDSNGLRLLLSSQGVVPVRSFFPSTRLAVAGGADSIADMESFISGRVG